MKILRNLFALLLLTVAVTSCTSDVTITDPKSETLEDVTAKTGDQGNEVDEREG